jgi:TonB family protein
MRPLAFTIIFIWCSGIAFAQQNQFQTSKIVTVSFIKKDGSYTNVRDSAEYIREISEPDSGSTFFNVSERYKNGKQKFLGKSSKREYIRAEGKCIIYFPSGITRSIENYKDNNQVGLCYYFYPNGKIYASIDYGQHNSDEDYSIDGDANYQFLFKDCSDSTGKVLAKNGKGHFVEYDYNFKYIEEEGVIKAGKRERIWTGQDNDFKIQFTEQYANGKLVSGKSTDSAGNKHLYFTRMIDPQYKGGMATLYEYLRNNIIYPEYAKKNGVQGTVILTFSVMTDGSLKYIKVARSVDEQLDEEAVRVLSRSRGWESAMYCGIPINFKYRLPVAFILK